MKQLLSLGLATVFLATGAIAQVGPSAQPEEVFRGVMRCSQENAELKASFTLNFRRLDSTWVSHRYDARTDEWTFLSGDIASLKKHGRQAFEQLSAKLGRPGGLVPQDLEHTVGPLEFLEVKDGAWVYTFLPSAIRGEKPMPADMVEALEKRFVVDPATGCAAALSMTATRSYKPGFLTRVDEFAFEHRFARVSGSDIPLLAGFTSRSKGTSLFSAYAEDKEATITDIEVIRD